MHDLVKPTSEIFKVSGMMFNIGFEAITEDQSRKQLADGANSNTWFMGHLVTCRYHTANMMGMEVTVPWNGVFDKSIGEVDQSKMPSLSEIKTAWDKITPKMEAHFEKLDADFLTADAPFKFPTESKSNWAAFAFMAMHEAYHVGQMSHNRRIMGVETIFSIAMKKMKAAKEQAEASA